MATLNPTNGIAFETFADKKDLTFTVVQGTTKYSFYAHGFPFEIEATDLSDKICPQIIKEFDQVHFEKKYAIFNKDGQKICDLEENKDFLTGVKVYLVAQRIFSTDH